jgi:hypothetical protein
LIREAKRGAEDAENDNGKTGDGTTRATAENAENGSGRFVSCPKLAERSDAYRGAVEKRGPKATQGQLALSRAECAEAQRSGALHTWGAVEKRGT